MERTDLFNFNPIKSQNDDLFNRLDLAHLIADYLILEKKQVSRVVAIEAGWGEGKTSTLNLIKGVIHEKAPESIVIEFNPWLVGNLSSVLEGFFLEFASAIGSRSKNDNAIAVSKGLLKLAKFLQPIKLIPGVEPWGTLVETVLSNVAGSTAAFTKELSLEERKREVERSLEELDAPIIVMIDDIDRLPPEEVRVVIQLVKAVANFNGVSYLLAYDPKPVVDVLSYNGVYDGRLYLEKIIQTKFTLPELSYQNRKMLFSSRIKMIRNEEDDSFKKDNEIGNDCLVRLARCRCSPRQIIQTVNAVKIMSCKLDGEVFFLDAVVFYFIETMKPWIIDVIRKQPHRFVVNYRMEEENVSEMIKSSGGERKEEMLNREMTNLLKENIKSEIERERWESLLNFVFPNVFNDIDRRSGNDVEDGRLNTKDALERILFYGTRTNDSFSREEVLRFIEDSDREEILSHVFTEYDFIDWLWYLQSFAKQGSIKNIRGFVNVLVGTTLKYLHRNHQNFLEDVAIFIRKIVAHANEDDRKAVFNKLTLESESLSFSELIIVGLLRDHGMWKNGVFYEESTEVVEYQYLPADYLVELVKNWLVMVGAESVKESFWHETEFIGILFRWGQLENNSYATVRRFLADKLKEEKYARMFAACFTEGKGVTGLENLIPDVSLLKKALEKAEFSEKDDARMGFVKISEYFKSLSNN